MGERAEVRELGARCGTREAATQAMKEMEKKKHRVPHRSVPITINEIEGREDRLQRNRSFICLGGCGSTTHTHLHEKKKKKRMQL